MTYKHKTHAVGADGKITSNADLDFYIDDVSLFGLIVNSENIVVKLCFIPINNCEGIMQNFILLRIASSPLCKLNLPIAIYDSPWQNSPSRC